MAPFTPTRGIHCRILSISRLSLSAVSKPIYANIATGLLKNNIKLFTLPRILVPGVVRNLKATHAPPLD
jgi:hypothetical protein